MRVKLVDTLSKSIYQECDGFYVLDTIDGGCLYAHHLRWLADELDEMNKDWNETIERELGNARN